MMQGGPICKGQPNEADVRREVPLGLLLCAARAPDSQVGHRPNRDQAQCNIVHLEGTQPKNQQLHGELQSEETERHVVYQA